MIKHKQAFAGDFSKIKHKLTSLFGDAEIDETDGIRFDYENSWLQMRLSNTEPIIRIIAESPSFDQSNSLLEKALKEIL